jgi:2,3-bisphosphoglycerate-independent phosphoglycerate mutase
MTAKHKLKNRPVGLLILDGWGYREETKDNAIAQANTPNWDKLYANHPHTLIKTSGMAVGLPEGQMGNSEVGHMNLGAGRIVYQELTRIQKDIDDGRFFQNNALLKAVDAAADRGHAVHILGLLSDGGVHSHINHIKAAVKLGVERGAQVFVHAFTDGRDTAPQSAIQYIEDLENYMEEIGGGTIASITGRFYALDRDNRWDRVKKAYEVITCAISDYNAPTAVEAVQRAYERGETDEFIQPTEIIQSNGERVKVRDGDSVIFMNFRSDRARQLTRAFIEEDFADFHRCATPILSAFVTLTEYNKNFEKFGALIAYRPTKLRNTFGEYIAKKGLTQLRIAETEKYAHVTFFFNGGVEAPNEGEVRVLINSPQVRTYDLQPEMSLPELTDKLVQALRSGEFDAFICNIANPDMVGHTGNMDACLKAVEAVDHALGVIVETVEEVGGELLVTADHGNMEMLVDPETGKPLTSHTTCPVPLVYVGHEKACKLRDGGILADIAPTLLDLMGLDKPEEMTGESLCLHNG